MVGDIAEEIQERRQDEVGIDRPYFSKWLAFFAFPLHAVFMKCYFQIDVTGTENIPSSGPFILAPTHRSRWDAFMLYRAVKGRFLYFMTSHVEVVGLQGWLMRRMGTFPINAQRPGVSAIRTFQAILGRGDALVIFPEGDLFYYGPGEVHPLKPGVAWLALKFQKSVPEANLPIIPIRLIYGDRLLKARSRVRVQIGEPIVVSDYAGLPSKEGIAALTSTLRAALGERIVEKSTAESLQDAISERTPRLSDPL